MSLPNGGLQQAHGRLRELFDELDINQNGTLSTAELLTGLRSLGIHATNEMVWCTIDRLMLLSMSLRERAVGAGCKASD